MGNMTLTRHLTPEQHNAWREFIKHAEPGKIVAYTGWSPGGRGYDRSRFVVRKWKTNISSPYSVHLEHDGLPFGFYDFNFGFGLIFTGAIALMRNNLQFNLNNTKPKSPSRMVDTIHIIERPQ
jgi:hypothetical protein